MGLSESKPGDDSSVLETIKTSVEKGVAGAQAAIGNVVNKATGNDASGTALSQATGGSKRRLLKKSAKKKVKKNKRKGMSKKKSRRM